MVSPRHGPLPRARLWDLDGSEYLDLRNGFGPTRFGHAPPFVAEAVASPPCRSAL
jgi:glutamate-1-semialdehyde aminotransferase